MAAPKSSSTGTLARKKTAPGLVVLSVLGHGGLLLGLGYIQVPTLHAATSIEVFEAKEKPKPPPPAKVEPPPPLEKPEPRANRKSAPAPQEAPPEAPPPQSAALSDLPDLGLELGNGPGGPGGVAVAPVGAQRPQPAQRSTVARSLGPSNAAKPAAADACEEPPAKPKPLTTPQPSYTAEARAAAVEGKVRVQLVVDENGAVVEARVIAGLGYGLDEAALAAARSWTFQPAVRCGRPSRATFTVAMRFTAS